MRLSHRSSLVLHALAGMLVAAVFVPRGAWADNSQNLCV